MDFKFQATLCCGISGGGMAGLVAVGGVGANMGMSGILGYDCLMIPGAKTRIANGVTAMNARGETQCGGNNGIGTDAAGVISSTICCKLCISVITNSMMLEF